jgi:hypothetical protein
MSAVPLVSKPLDIRTASLSGRLMVYANPEKGTLCWVFRYDNEVVEPAPVVISVAVNQRIHLFYCGVTEKINRIVKTRSIYPDFPIGTRIQVVSVEPQVSVRLESLGGYAVKRLIAALVDRIVRPFRRQGPEN